MLNWIIKKEFLIYSVPSNLSQAYYKGFLFCLVILCGISLPTIQGDNAFYLTKYGAEATLSQKQLLDNGLISYGGLVEWILIHIIPSYFFFIIGYKILIFSCNLFFFLMTVNQQERYSSGLIKFLLCYLAMYFYLTPGCYSLVLSGFSCAYLASCSKHTSASILFWLLALFFCGFDLPNPKYIGLAFIVYLYGYFLSGLLVKEKKNWSVLSVNCAIFCSVICLLLVMFLRAKIDAPIGYFVAPNGILLDLVGRDYFSALLPFKRNRSSYFPYLVTLLYLQYVVFRSIHYKTQGIKIILMLGLIYYFSLGILEPSYIVRELVKKYSILSFYRTRAGFDLTYLFCLYMTFQELSKYEKQRFVTYSKLFIFLFLVAIIPVMVRFMPIFIDNVKSVKKQTEVLDFFQRVNEKTDHGCYLSSEGYSDNSVFGFGPTVARLATNFSHIDYNDFRIKLKRLKAHKQSISAFDRYNLLAKALSFQHAISFKQFSLYQNQFKKIVDLKCDIVILDQQYMRAIDVMGTPRFNVLDQSNNYLAINVRLG